MLWQLPEQRELIREWLWDNLTPGSSDGISDQTRFLVQGLASEGLEMVKKTSGDVTGEAGARQADLDSISSILNELGKIEKLLQQNKNDLERHIQLLDALPNHLWLPQDDAQSAKQHLTPLANDSLSAVSQILSDTISLKLALSSEEIDNDVRVSVIETLWPVSDATFTEEELQMSLKEAKRQYKGDELRRWKAARKEV